MSEEEKKSEAEESTEEKDEAGDKDGDAAADKDDADEEGKEAAPPPKKRGRKEAGKAATPAKAKKGGKKKTGKASHPRTLDMITEALENLADRKGSSVQAIKAYILHHFKTVRPDMIKTMMRRALSSGLEQGIIGRPKGQVDSRVLSGRYVMKKGKTDDEVISTPKSRPASLRQPKSLKASTKKGKKGKKARRPVAKKAKKAKSPAKKPAKKAKK